MKKYLIVHKRSLISFSLLLFLIMSIIIISKGKAQEIQYKSVILFPSIFVNNVGNPISLPYSSPFNWQLVGSAPYLNSKNYPTSYINNLGASNIASGYTEFQNITQNNWNIENITMNLNYRLEGGYQAFLYLRNNATNGASWTYFKQLNSTNSNWVWLNSTVTTYFNSTAKINQARIGFCHDTANLVGIYFDYVELKIWYNSPPDYSGFVTKIIWGLVSIVMLILAPIISDKMFKGDILKKIFVWLMLWLLFGFMFYSWIYMW